MAFASVVSTKEPRSISLGPIKMEIHTWTSANTDTSGTATATALENVDHIVVDGMEHTAAPTFSGKAVTLAFKDPGANAFGTLIMYGK